MTDGMTAGRPAQLCAHCLRHPLGYAATADGRPLCHPSYGERIDCYHLVTVYGHQTPCMKGCIFGDDDD